MVLLFLRPLQSREVDLGNKTTEFLTRTQYCHLGFVLFLSSRVEEVLVACHASLGDEIFAVGVGLVGTVRADELLRDEVVSLDWVQPIAQMSVENGDTLFTRPLVAVLPVQTVIVVHLLEILTSEATEFTMSS